MEEKKEIKKFVAILVKYKFTKIMARKAIGNFGIEVYFYNDEGKELIVRLNERDLEEAKDE